MHGLCFASIFFIGFLSVCTIFLLLNINTNARFVSVNKTKHISTAKNTLQPIVQFAKLRLRLQNSQTFKFRVFHSRN